jgi:hypothetical protein
VEAGNVRRLEASSTGSDRVDALWRVLAALASVVLGLGCAVMIAAISDIGGTPTCHDVSTGKAAVPSDGQCFGGSSLQKTISLGLGYPSGVIAGVAALLAIAFALTGRRGRLVLALTVAAVVLGGLSVLIGSV